MLNQLAQILEVSHKILFLPRGISVPAEFPTFGRAEDLSSGQYRGYEPEEIISHSFLLPTAKLSMSFTKIK